MEGRCFNVRVLATEASIAVGAEAVQNSVEPAKVCALPTAAQITVHTHRVMAAQPSAGGGGNRSMVGITTERGRQVLG
eukprot:SAG11_NODE_5767_length_1467_cov_1.316520_4_plen_77_part_01